MGNYFNSVRAHTCDFLFCFFSSSADPCTGIGWKHHSARRFFASLSNSVFGNRTITSFNIWRDRSGLSSASNVCASNSMALGCQGPAAFAGLSKQYLAGKYSAFRKKYIPILADERKDSTALPNLHKWPCGGH